MKAIIPVAGAGSKLRPYTYTQPKALVPVAGKAILGHIVDYLLSGGVHEFIFITGYMGMRIQDYMMAHYGHMPEVKMSFVLQDKRLGSAHAVAMAHPYVAEDPEILILLGDTLVDLDLNSFLLNQHSAIGLKKVKTPGHFGIAEVNREGWVTKTIEKPRIPKSNWALVGVYKIQNVPLYFEGTQWIMQHNVKTEGEYQITDVLMYMLEKGEPIQAVEVNNWYDCGKKDSLLEANALLLNRPDFHRADKHPKDSNTIVIHPVQIGDRCTIRNSIIGPNVVIGDYSVIENCLIRDSIIGSFSELDSLILNHSLIGNESTLKGLSQSLNVGDDTEINFS